MYKIKYHKSVLRFLSKHKNIHKHFFDKIESLKKNPFDSSLDIVSLKWAEKWAYRLRIWKYRFKFLIISNEVVIYFYDAWARGDIYKK